MRNERYAYPARIPEDTHICRGRQASTRWWRGRVTELGEDGGVLLAGGLAQAFELAPTAATVEAGDLVGLRGREADGLLTVDESVVLAPALRWPGRFAPDASSLLTLRQTVVGAVREFFAERGFVEAETPTLVTAPGQEPYLDPLFTCLKSPRGDATPRYLITSPEHHMKRLLGRGCERIFQLCHCFRNGERSSLHRPEFAMVEWYRAWATYREIAADVADLVAHVSQQVVGSTCVEWRGRRLDLTPPWQHITVRQAFAVMADVELPKGPDGAALCAAARRAGCRSVTDDDSWEDAFHKILLDRVEPGLAQLGAVMLEEYPASLAALAKVREAKPAVADRFEAYVGGIELANGFTELNDPREQRRRFMEERQRRRARGAEAVPLDEDFLAMMETGMPPAGGVALGLDRLIMVLADAASIDEIIAFPGE